MSRPVKATLIAALTGAALFLTAAPALAAPSAWWHLFTGARPAYLHPGLAQNEVQELTVDATSGTYQLIEPGAFNEGERVKGKTYVELPFNAGAAQIRAALEGIYGVGSAEVTETAPAEFRIAFVGPRADQSPPFAGNGEIVLEELAHGQPDGEIYVTAANLGDASATGLAQPIELSDSLPPGLRAVAIEGSRPEENGSFQIRKRLPCSLATLTCTLQKNTLGRGPSSLDALAPFDRLELRIAVVVEPGAHSGELNEASISGGESFACQAVPAGTGSYRDYGCQHAQNAGSYARTPLGPIVPASTSRPITVSAQPSPYGFEAFEIRNEEEGGALAAQAAGHPFQQTTTIVTNQTADLSPPGSNTEFGPLSSEPLINAVGLPKDVDFRWPPGLLGDPTPLPQCSTADFFEITLGGGADACKPQAAVGAVTVDVNEPALARVVEATVPIFNLVPGYGEPARLGFIVPIANAPVIITPALRGGDGADYGLTINNDNLPQGSSLLSAEATVWGTPGDPRHNSERGWACQIEDRGHTEFKPEEIVPCRGTETTSKEHPSAFLTMPTGCAGPLQTTLESDPWSEIGAFQTFPGAFGPSELLGCNRVPFAPKIEALPTADSATSPTGLEFSIGFENEGLTNPTGLAESNLKRAVVSLPEGFTINPSVAEGLKACSLAEYEATTLQAGTGCLEESKIGAVEIESPLVPQKVSGSLFIAQQGSNPYHNLTTIYLVAKNPEIGVLIQQALKVTPDPVTGQLTTEVDNVPQLPFSHFHLSFRQGQRSPLITPPACGVYTVKAKLYPYSAPEVANEQESSFTITQGPEGLPCPSGGTPPFHPVLEAGTINNAAGTYSPFYTHISRKDSEQEITHFSIKLPPGVIGKLAGVSECSDAAIAHAKSLERVLGGGTTEDASPSCPANSEVGHTLVGSGVGNVLAYAPGKLYLAGPYHGSNISLVSITAAKVGPFDLGTVVVRFALKIDPETAEVFVDGQGSDPIPHIVDGIPVHLRDIRAYVDRPDFTLNPTSCAKKSTASTVLGSGLNFASEADDQPVTVTSPFQAADCANLGFAPKLALSLKGGTKRGATPAFKAVLTYPKGSYANIAKSVVTLPHSEFLEQSHIKTICTRAQFKEGKIPGEKCPAASIYGKAEAITPLLAEPLKGPVYLRSSSHNLPDLVAALHNNQVDFALDGRIDSVKNGRIRNTFETVPDAPVSKFVLEMQGGKKGLLVNSANLCKGANRAISEFTGQNGKLSNSNPVLAAKCPKAKKKGAKAKKGKRVARAGR